MTTHATLPMFVISLPESADRRRCVTDQMGAAGLKFSFLDAVDGRKGDHTLLSRFDARAFMIRHGRPSVPGEAGCYASHYLAWQRCIELDRPVVILEDDFLLEPDAAERFALAARLALHFDFLRLEPFTTKLTRALWSDGEDRVVRFLRIPQCATCYQVTPAAARALVEASARFVYPVDVFIRNQFLHGVPIHGLVPPPVRRVPDSGAISIIGNRHVEKGPLWCKLSKGAIRSANALQNGLTNLRFMATVDRERSRKDGLTPSISP
jgi:glycosyl transferase, family 25